MAPSTDSDTRMKYKSKNFNSHHDHYIQRPLSLGFSQFHLSNKFKNQAQVKYSPFPSFIVNLLSPTPIMVDPFWGNNWEASLSMVECPVWSDSEEETQPLLSSTDNMALQPYSQTHQETTPMQHTITEPTQEKELIFPSRKRKSRKRPTLMKSKEVPNSTNLQILHMKILVFCRSNCRQHWVVMPQKVNPST